MGLLFIVLSFVLSEKLVELEPVRAINCAHYNVSANNFGNCLDTPYCIVVAGQCYNDPCLHYVDSSYSVNADCGTRTDVVGDGSKQCELVSWTPYCPNGTSVTRKYCQYPELLNYGPMTSCIWENLKSNGSVCDLWSCNPDASPISGSTFCDTISPRNPYLCTDLPTETYCKLNPHCYWGGSSTKCIEDTCTRDGSDCDTHNNTNNGGTESCPNCGKKCVSYNIFDGSGNGTTEKIMCVDPDKNAAPNKCWDLAENSTANHPESGSGVCATYTLPICAANEECTPQFRTVGPYSGYYCGDANHTSPDSSVLAHAPAMILIVLAILAFW